MRYPLIKRKVHRQSGITMIELMIAGIVMVVGFLGMMILIITAIGTNNRNKLDTSATLVAQMVMEEIRANIATGSSPALVDCNGNSWTIGVGSPTPGTSSGGTLSGGTVQLTGTAPTNYSMNYSLCTANGGQATYEVRWNVTTLTSGASVITVTSRPKGASNDLKYFALPVTLRGIAGV
jgi:Tfp pilus assembly protein PilV